MKGDPEMSRNEHMQAYLDLCDRIYRRLAEEGK